jgi:hypothetical protein
MSCSRDVRGSASEEEKPTVDKQAQSTVEWMSMGWVFSKENSFNSVVFRTLVNIV